MKNFLITLLFAVILNLLHVSCGSVTISDQLKEKSDLAFQQAIGKSN